MVEKRVHKLEYGTGSDSFFEVLKNGANNPR